MGLDSDVARAEEFLKARPQGSTVKAMLAALGFKRDNWEKSIRKRLLDDSIADFIGERASCRWYHHEHIPLEPPHTPSRRSTRRSMEPTNKAEILRLLSVRGPTSATDMATHLDVAPQQLGSSISALLRADKIKKVRRKYELVSLLKVPQENNPLIDAARGRDVALPAPQLEAVSAQAPEEPEMTLGAAIRSMTVALLDEMKVPAFTDQIADGDLATLARLGFALHKVKKKELP